MRPSQSRTLRIGRLPRNDVTNAASRIINVTEVSRNYMEVQMLDCLAGRLSDVDSQIEPVRRVIPFDDGFDRPCTFQQRGALNGSRFEEFTDVPSRYDERVPGRNRIRVPNAKDV